MTDQGIFRGVIGGNLPPVQEFNFELGRAGIVSKLDQDVLENDPNEFLKNDDNFMDKEELLIKQQTAMMQK